MSRGLEYVVMMFLVGAFIVLLIWSGNGRYQVSVSSSGAVFVDTRTGDAWTLRSKEMIISPANK